MSSTPSIPLHAYSDPEIYAREMDLLFRRGPGYVGHTGLVPEIGDYHTIKHESHGRMLTRTPAGVRLVSNICRHKQALIYEGSGQARAITCSLHQWTWDLEGQMQGAPHFSENPCMQLRTWPLQDWRGLLFAGKCDIARDLASVGYEDIMNFDDYAYHHTEHHTCQYNWKTFMEIYGDDYHVAPYHPGLSKMLDMRSLEVTHGSEWHMQTMRSTEHHRGKLGPVYEAWREKCLNIGSGKLPEYGAIWFAYYPNVMVEVYPYTITVSTLHPISPTETMNQVDFYYHHDVDESLIEAERRAYMETALEDDDIAERMSKGHRLLERYERDWGYTEGEMSGPCHPHLEAGTAHFIEWYERKMKGV